MESAKFFEKQVFYMALQKKRLKHKTENGRWPLAVMSPVGVSYVEPDSNRKRLFQYVQLPFLSSCQTMGKKKILIIVELNGKSILFRGYTGMEYKPATSGVSS